MAVTKEILTVKDFTDSVKEITGLVKESYLNGVRLSLSLWEDNLKVLNAQVDQWFNVQQNYTNGIRKFYERFPKEVEALLDGNSIAMNGQINRIAAFQKDYVESARKVSDKFTKGTLNLAQKNAEKAVSLIDGYISLFRV